MVAIAGDTLVVGAPDGADGKCVEGSGISSSSRTALVSAADWALRLRPGFGGADKVADGRATNRRDRLGGIVTVQDEINTSIHVAT